MAVGLAGSTLAQKWLDMLSGTAFTQPAGSFVQLHTADPGAAGTTSPCTGTVGSARKSVTYGAASTSAGTTTKAMSSTPSWASFDVAQTITHISVWDASTAGNFLFSAQLPAPGKAVAVGDTFNLTSLSVALTPIAA